MDPGAPWRELYSTEDEARAFVAVAGGLLRLYDGHLLAAGLVRTARPGGGSVGLVRADSPWRVMGAVCVEPGFWSTVAPEGGLMVSAARHVIAWEVPV